jgi:hypothetical protein
LIEDWQVNYSAERPHSSLEYRTTKEFATVYGRGKEGGLSLPRSASPIMIGPKKEGKAEPTRLRIAFFGAFGVGNLGNECTLQALLYNIRRYTQDAGISRICSGPEETRSAYKISATPIREMTFLPINNRLLRLIRRIFVGIPMELFRWLKAITRLKDVDKTVPLQSHISQRRCRPASKGLEQAFREGSAVVRRLSILSRRIFEGLFEEPTLRQRSRPSVSRTWHLAIQRLGFPGVPITPAINRSLALA